MPAFLHIRGARYGISFSIDLPLGDKAITPTAGGSTWTEEARPERTAMTIFEGNDLVRLDVPVRLDGFEAGRSIEPELSELLRICRGHDGNPAPDFVASGPLPNNYSGLRYVMEYPDFDQESTVVRSDGERIRQLLTCKLVQFVDPDTLKPERRQAKTRVVTLSRPMTYVQIASHWLHDPHRGKEVAKLNGDRDPRKKRPKGAKVRIPGS